MTLPSQIENPFSAGTTSPSFDGIESGLISARTVPGASLEVHTALVYWNAGTRGTRATGNTATVPTSHATEYRIDVYLDNNTWISGTSQAGETSCTWPAITAGRTWLAAVMRRPANEVLTFDDDGTNGVLIALNTTTQEIFYRVADFSTAVGDATPIELLGSFLPIRTRGGTARLGGYAYFNPTAGQAGDFRLLIDGANPLPVNGPEIFSGVGSSVRLLNGNYSMTYPFAAGTHNLRNQFNGAAAAACTCYGHTIFCVVSK